MAHSLGRAGSYKNTWDCIRMTLRNEGPAAFYKGTLARMGRVVPGQAVVFSCYESITQFLTQFLEL